MRIYLKPGLKFLGFFSFLKFLLLFKFGRGGIAYVNYILKKLNFHDYLYDSNNDVKFRVKYNDLISMAILKYGCYEENSLKLALRILRYKPGLFLDIGANFGLYTIYASKIDGVRTIAIDGLPESFALLLGNIELNQLREKITACNLVLASHKHYAFFGHHDQGNLGSSRIKEKLNKDQPRQFVVDTTTLDGLLEFIHTDSSSISLVKLDIEGHEYEALKNSTFLERYRPPYILTEILEENENSKKLIELFIDHQYTPFTITGEKYEAGSAVPESNLLFLDNLNPDSLWQVYERPA